MKFSVFLIFSILSFQTTNAQTPEWINYSDYENINSIAGNGNIMWLGAGGGLVRMNTNTLEKEYFDVCNSDLISQGVYPRLVDSSGNLWFTYGTSSRGIIIENSIAQYLVKFDGNKMKYFPIDMSNWERRGFSTTKIVKDKNNFFIGTWGKGLLLFDGINWTLFDTLNSDIPTNNILDISIDDNGNLWLGSLEFEGLISYNNSEWIVFDSTNSGCPNEPITNIEIDKNGKIWLTTLDKLVSFQENQWDVYNTLIPEGNNLLGKPLRLDANNEPWLLHDKLYHFSENKWSAYPIEPKIHYYQNSAFYIDKNNNKWLSSNLKTPDGYMDYFKDGLSRFNNGVWNTYSL